MKIEKFMKALGNALKKPKDPQKLGRLNRFVGRALAAESEEDTRVLLQIREAIHAAALTATQLTKAGHSLPLTPHLQAIKMMFDGFFNNVIPLNPPSLVKTLLDVRVGSRPPSSVFILIGIALSKANSLDELQMLPTMRSVLASNANALESCEESEQILALQIRTLLDIIAMFETISSEKYCAWCCKRMKRYWIINMKPLQNEASERARGWYPTKVCDICKGDSVLMERFYLESKKSHCVL